MPLLVAQEALYDPLTTLSRVWDFLFVNRGLRVVTFCCLIDDLLWNSVTLKNLNL
jgi:hypothetical protein